MKLVILAIRDRALDAFGTPMFMTHVNAGKRGFGDEINNPRSPMFAHPEDFDMFKLGVYNDEDGSFELHKPEQIAIGKDLKKVVAENVATFPEVKRASQ